MDESNGQVPKGTRPGLEKAKLARWVPFVAWLKVCVLVGVGSAWALGFFKSNSFIRSNATFLYLGFLFLGLLLGIYLGVGRAPSIQGVISTLIVFIGVLVILGGAAVFVSGMDVLEQQTIGMCLSCLGIFTIIGAAAGLIMRVLPPSVAKDIRDKYLQLSMMLLELTLEYEEESDNTRKDRLKGDIAILQRILSSTPIEDTGSEIGFRRITG
ncbi:MAG: hypothetical protein JXA49_00090 [Actinobacteria bacterium]|nr:hypothetical protein [Actinomycetota bacterium]